ncbi:hypothetical protein B0H13DRAFT_2041685 [Mycena leptocephala]|nr:hypothetical protein B0H13DRAFT_2041685 [Mycena leptocephala]
MRRETLNGRFLTLASLLPPLAALRRPSKAAIVSSSIATVHASRRHRVLAAQTLRALSREAEGLRREVNEWRARARVPQLELPVRSEGHAHRGARARGGRRGRAEEDNDNDNEGVESPVSPKGQQQQQQQHGQQARARSASTISTPGSSHGHAGFFGPAPIPSHRQSQTRNNSTSKRTAGALRMKGYDGKGFYDAPGAAGAAYDLGLGFDGEESLLLGSSGLGVGAGGMVGGWAGASPSHPAFHQQQQQVQQQAIRLREVYEQQQAMLASGMGMGISMGMQMPIAGMGMGMGVPFGVAGVAQGQYLHQPARFA